VSGVQLVVFSRSEDLLRVFARRQGSVGYVVSNLDKLSPGVYRILCGNQLRHGYLDHAVSEPYN